MPSVQARSQPQLLGTRDFWKGGGGQKTWRQLLRYYTHLKMVAVKTAFDILGAAKHKLGVEGGSPTSRPPWLHACVSRREMFRKFRDMINKLTF